MSTEYPKTLYKNGKFDSDQKEVKDAQDEARARSAGFADRYEYQEYPKALHPMGDRTKPERVVASKEEERKARAEGYLTIHEVESGETSIAPDPELEHLPAEVLAAVTAAGKESVVGRALLTQFPAPEREAKPRKGKKDE